MRHPPTPSRCSPRRCRWFCLVLFLWNTVALVPHEERPRGDVSVDGDQDLSDTSVPREEEDEEPQALGEEHTEEDAPPDKHAEMDSPNAKARDVAIAADGSSSSSSSSSSTSSTARARDEDEQEIVPDRSSSNNMLLRRARDRGLGSPVDAGAAASPSAQSTAATREIDNLDGGLAEPIISGVDQHRTKKSDRATKRAGAASAPAAEAPREPAPTVALTAGRFEKSTATVVLHPDDDLRRDQASDTPWTTLSGSASSTSSAATSEHENGSSAASRTFSAALFQSVLTVVSGTGLERDPHKTLPSSDLEHTLRQRLNLQDSLVLFFLLGFYWGTLLLGAQLVYRLSCNKSSIRYYNNALFDGTMKDRDAADVPDHVEGQHRRWSASLWSACGDLWAAAVGVLPSASGRGQMGAGRSESTGSGGCEIDVGAGTRRTTTSGAGAATGAAPASSEVAAEVPGRNSMELLFCDSTDTEAFVGCFLAPPEHVQLRVRGWRRESIQVAQSWGMLQPLLGQSAWDVVFGARYGLVPAFDIALDVHNLCEPDHEGPSKAFVAAPEAEVSHCTTTTSVHDQKQDERGPAHQRQSEASPASSTSGSTLQLQGEVEDQVASSTSAAAASSSTTGVVAAHQSPAASEDAPRAPAPPSTTTHQAPVQIAKPAPLAAEKIMSSPELQRHVITHFIRRTTKDNPLEVLRIEKHTAWPAFPQVARKIRTFLSSPEVQFPGVVSISYSAVDVVHVQSNEGWANFLRNQTTFWLMVASGVGLLWYLPYLQCKNIVTKTRARYKISKSAEEYWNCLQSDLGSVFATAIAAGGAASAPVAAGGAGPPGPG